MEVRLFRIVRCINVFFILAFLGAVVFNLFISPANDLSTAFEIFVAVVLCLFCLPFYLAIRALGGKGRGSRAIFVLSVWIAFIVVGITAAEQDRFTIIICAVMVCLSMINIVSIYMHGKYLKRTSREAAA